MSGWMHRLRKIAAWSSVLLVLAQIAAMLGLTANDSLRKNHRKLRRFPYVPAEPLSVDADKITVYTYGEELYADMLAAIDRAQETVYFETFIWKADAVGEAFKAALGRAAERGVRVYAIWDDFANLVVPRRFLRTMPDGVHVMRHPAFPRPWRPKTWGRDHRKLLIVDSHTGFVGGYNIGQLYATGWRDTHARVVGPGAIELENAFIDFWNQHAVDRKHQPLHEPRRRWFSEIRVQRNSPRIKAYPIRDMYLEAIDRASERIWLTHAYLIPDRDLVTALITAARRGVDVRIIVPAQSNHVVADWLSRGFYAELLRGGVRLFLYRDAMVHSKTAVIDGTWSTIGTANLDRLSLRGNYEVNLDVTDHDLAEWMEQVFAKDQTNTIELDETRWQRRSWLAKFTEQLLSPWRPMF